jgi:hypothetical protein
MAPSVLQLVDDESAAGVAAAATDAAVLLEGSVIVRVEKYVERPLPNPGSTV